MPFNYIFLFCFLVQRGGPINSVMKKNIYGPLIITPMINKLIATDTNSRHF